MSVNFLFVNGFPRRGAVATLILAVAALTLSACGDSGPQGAAGAAGAKGAIGPTGPAGAGVSWVDVTGASAQAATNTGYIADSSAQVTITLPASATVGNIVQVLGAASGGWKIAQNSGQQVYVGFENALWTAVGPSQGWVSLMRFADGQTLAGRL